MQHARSCVLVAALASACGPLVPVDADTDAADTGESAGTNEPDDDDDGRPEETGIDEDGAPGSDVGEVDDGGEVDTGIIETCGDGILDPGEVCDDGNDDPGDGCEIDCTATPGLLLWSQVIDGDGDDDAAYAVAVGQASEILVAGALEIAGSEDAWLQMFAPDGSTLSQSIVDLGSDEIATSVAVTWDGIAYVAGLQPSSDRALLLQLGDTGLVELEGAPTDIVPFTALVSATAEGFVLVTNAGGFDEISAIVRRFDGAGGMIGDVLQPPNVFVGAAIGSLDGGTILGGGSFGGMGTGNTAWLAMLASDATGVWSDAGDANPQWSLRLRGIAVAPDGRIVGVGTRGMDGMGGGGNDDDEGWIWWWTSDGQPDGEGPLDIGGAAARPTAVVVGAHGIVVGGSAVDNEDGFVAGYSIDGALQWGYELAGDRGFEDGVSALALDPGVGVIAVGAITNSTGTDAWVGLFSE